MFEQHDKFARQQHSSNNVGQHDSASKPKISANAYTILNKHSS